MYNFRVYDKIKEKMTNFPLVVSYFVTNEMIGHHGQQLIARLENSMVQFNNKDFTIMQYTGIKDKHEVEICEGDIVSYRPDINKPFKYYEIIQAPSGEWRLNNRTSGRVLYFVQEDCEIVGNIYENLELWRRYIEIGGKQ